MPQNLSQTLCGVIRYPHCDRMSACARLKIGSLSTSTPSQSKMTRSGAVFIVISIRAKAWDRLGRESRSGEVHNADAATQRRIDPCDRSPPLHGEGAVP